MLGVFYAGILYRRMLSGTRMHRSTGLEVLAKAVYAVSSLKGVSSAVAATGCRLLSSVCRHA